MATNFELLRRGPIYLHTNNYPRQQKTQITFNGAGSLWSFKNTPTELWDFTYLRSIRDQTRRSHFIAILAKKYQKMHCRLAHLFIPSIFHSHLYILDPLRHSAHDKKLDCTPCFRGS